METEIKFIKEPFQLIPVDLDIRDSTKITAAKEKTTMFSSTFQTLSNQESVSIVSGGKKKRGGWGELQSVI